MPSHIYSCIHLTPPTSNCSNSTGDFTENNKFGKIHNVIVSILDGILRMWSVTVRQTTGSRVPVRVHEGKSKSHGKRRIYTVGVLLYRDGTHHSKWWLDHVFPITILVHEHDKRGSEIIRKDALFPSYNNIATLCLPAVGLAHEEIRKP